MEGRFSTMRLDPARRHLGGILWMPLKLSCLIGKVNKFIQVVNYWKFKVTVNGSNAPTCPFLVLKAGGDTSSGVASELRSSPHTTCQ